MKDSVKFRKKRKKTPRPQNSKLTEVLGTADGDKLGDPEGSKLGKSDGEALGMDDGSALTLGRGEIVGLVVGA